MRDKGKFLTIGLIGWDTNLFMELYPTDQAQRNWDCIEQEFNERYASLTRKEEASEMVQHLTSAAYEEAHPDQRSALTAIIAHIEHSAVRQNFASYK